MLYAAAIRLAAKDRWITNFEKINNQHLHSSLSEIESKRATELRKGNRHAFSRISKANSAIPIMRRETE